jgi:cob(I)alamin adenosyltransferase
MKNYSKTGDLGETSVLNGGRVSKNDLLIHFLGETDELNSRLGLVKVMFQGDDVCQFIEEIQKKLMKLMSHVSDIENEKYFFKEDEITVLENEIDKLNEKTGEQLNFVIPGKNITEAQIHLARTSARKTERIFFAVNEQYSLCKNAGAYLNRLSDYLFVLSQYHSESGVVN